MQPPIPEPPEIREIRRLETLLPLELRSQITIAPSEQSRRSPITTHKTAQGQYSIQIDFHLWRQFTGNQRDLLFWHEVARIQSRTIGRSAWEKIVISIGISAALMELTSHSLIAFSVALAVTGLASYRLYQRQQGEQSLREITAADQSSIELAMQFGYSFSEAHSSLYEALQMLTKQRLQKSRQNKYQVRLRVLEILAAQEDISSQPFILNLGASEKSESTRKKIQNLGCA